MNEENMKLNVVGELSQVFPDIEGQLCSKHSTLMGKLKMVFNKLYDSMEPSHFIVVKGIANIVCTNQTSLSLALENGIILMVTRTFETSNIYLNGNHIDEEVIFSHTGILEEGLYEMGEQLEKAFGVAIDGMNPSQLFGGIIYIHANIPQDFFEYRKSVLLAFYLSILVINNKIPSVSVQEIIEKLLVSQLISDQNYLQRQFYDYQNRKMCLMVPNQTFKAPLDQNLKFVLCRLGLASSDIRHTQKEIKLHQQYKQLALNQFQKTYNYGSLYEAFVNNVDLNKFLQSHDQKMLEFVQYGMMELKGLCQFSNQEIDIQQLITLKWELEKSKFSEEVLELVEELKEKTKIQTCVIVERQFLLLAVDRKKYTELICMLRQLLHKGELKSKSCFKIDEELVEDRWTNDQKIGQKIFASAPSSGVAIYDPSQAIWFD